MATTVTRSQSNRTPLGHGWTREWYHGCGDDKSVTAEWRYHFNIQYVTNEVAADCLISQQRSSELKMNCKSQEAMLHLLFERLLLYILCHLIFAQWLATFSFKFYLLVKPRHQKSFLASWIKIHYSTNWPWMLESNQDNIHLVFCISYISDALKYSEAKSAH